MKSLVSDFPPLVVDQSAETIKELCRASGRGKSWVHDFARAQIEAGRWEKVQKRVGNTSVPAYRRKK